MYAKTDSFILQVMGKQILPTYLKVVESSYFNSSDKVMFFLISPFLIKNLAKILFYITTTKPLK